MSRKLPHHTPTHKARSSLFAQLSVSRVVDNPWASAILISYTEPSSMAALFILNRLLLCKKRPYVRSRHSRQVLVLKDPIHKTSFWSDLLSAMWIGPLVVYYLCRRVDCVGHLFIINRQVMIAGDTSLISLFKCLLCWILVSYHSINVECE